MAWTAVYPPMAAERDPVRAGSASSRPGSRRWVCRSTRPGRAINPSASSVCASSGASMSGATSTIVPFRSRRSTGSPPSGRAPRIRQGAWVWTGIALWCFLFEKRFCGRRVGTVAPGRGGRTFSGPTEKQIEDGHAQADTVGNLFGDGAPGRVGDLGGDLHAADHGTWVHDKGVLRHTCQSFAIESVVAAVLTHGGEEGVLHAFGLYTQHHHHVRLGQHLVEVVGDLAGPSGHRHRHEGGACHEGDGG